MRRTGKRFDVRNFGAIWLLAVFALTTFSFAYAVEGLIDGAFFVPLGRGNDLLFVRSSNPSGYYASLVGILFLVGYVLFRFASVIRDFVGLAPADVNPLHVLVLTGLVVVCWGYGVEAMLDGNIFLPFGGDSDVRLVKRLNPVGFYGALATLFSISIFFLVILMLVVRKFISSERGYWRDGQR